MISYLIAPLMHPMGLGDSCITTALITGFLAKEVLSPHYPSFWKNQHTGIQYDFSVRCQPVSFLSAVYTMYRRYSLY